MTRMTLRSSMPAILMLAACLLFSLVSAVRFCGGVQVEFKRTCDMDKSHNLSH